MELFALTLNQFINEHNENLDNCNIESLAINHPRPWLSKDANNLQLVQVFQSLVEGILR